ncbi:SET_domain [Hexamita inflata]|nr:SET domain [Hexamita inflata]
MVKKMQKTNVVDASVIQQYINSNEYNDSKARKCMVGEYDITRFNSNLLSYNQTTVSQKAFQFLKELQKDKCVQNKLKSQECNCVNENIDGCDETCPNWTEYNSSLVNRECSLTCKSKNCSNKLFTNMMNDLINKGFAHQLYVSDSQNPNMNKGLFARDKISAGTFIGPYLGYYSLKSEEIFKSGYGIGFSFKNSIQNEIDDLFEEEGDQLIIDADFNYNLVKYMNSYCYSTVTQFQQIFVNGFPFIVVALLQQVYKDQEIVADYGKQYISKFQYCSCKQWCCTKPKSEYILKLDKNDEHEIINVDSRCMKKLQAKIDFFCYYLYLYQLHTTGRAGQKIRCEITGSAIMDLIQQLWTISTKNQYPDIFISKRQNRCKPHLLHTEKDLYEGIDEQYIQEAIDNSIETACIQHKKQIIKELQYIVLPFNLSVKNKFNINDNNLVVIIPDYPRSCYQQKWNNKEHSLFLNVISSKLYILSPYMYPSRTISAQQLLIDGVRFLDLCLYELYILISFYLDTVVTQAINQFMNSVVNEMCMTTKMFHETCDKTFEKISKILNALCLQSYTQANELIQKIVSQDSLQQLQNAGIEYNLQNYLKDEYKASMFQQKTIQATSQQYWEYQKINASNDLGSKYFQCFRHNEALYLVFQFYLLNPGHRRDVERDMNIHTTDVQLIAYMDQLMLKQLYSE